MSIPHIVLEEIEQLKAQWEYEKALKKVNWLLSRDPTNREALYQVADIEYRRWEISKAEKPVDFLLETNNEDAMSWYIKGVLEMEKTNRWGAKEKFQKALDMLEQDNPEIMRCYGLCEYWSWNREAWMWYLIDSHKINALDAEVILNIIEISILEKELDTAKEFISYYHKHKKKLQCFDRDESYYNDKILLFEEYLKW